MKYNFQNFNNYAEMSSLTCVFFSNLLIKFLVIFMSCNLNTSVSFPLHENNQYQQFCWCEFKFVLKSVDIESSFPNT